MTKKKYDCVIILIDNNCTCNYFNYISITIGFSAYILQFVYHPNNELNHLKAFHREFQKANKESEKVKSQEIWMYKVLLEKNVNDCYPNIKIAFNNIPITYKLWS